MTYQIAYAMLLGMTTTIDAPAYPKMDPDWKAEWLDALRSGEYQQGYEHLKPYDSVENSQTYCCLGVLCDVAQKKGMGEWTPNLGADLFSYKNRRSIAFPPSTLMGEIGLDDHAATKIAETNDLGETSFVQIAAWIEENL